MVLFAILNASQLFNNLTFIGFYNMFDMHRKPQKLQVISKIITYLMKNEILRLGTND